MYACVCKEQLHTFFRQNIGIRKCMCVCVCLYKFQQLSLENAATTAAPSLCAQRGEQTRKKDNTHTHRHKRALAQNLMRMCHATNLHACV